MLTHLPKEYTPESMCKAAELDRKIRLEGGAHLQAAAEAYGTKRYVVQSSGFWYAPGLGFADESTPFAFEATPGIASGARVYTGSTSNIPFGLKRKLERFSVRKWVNIKSIWTHLRSQNPGALAQLKRYV